MSIWCILLTELLLNFFKTFDKYVSEKYVTTMNKFIRESKMNQKEHMGYILTQIKLYMFILRQLDFFTIVMKNYFNTISSQAIGKQRMFIDPQAFIDMNEDFIG